MVSDVKGGRRPIPEEREWWLTDMQLGDTIAERIAIHLSQSGEPKASR